MNRRSDFQNHEFSPHSFGPESENGYTYIPGSGFVVSDPATTQRRHLRYVAGHVGIAMVFYILLSAFITLPVVLMYSSFGLPVGINFNTMRVYGTQLTLQLVTLTTTIVRLGIPILFLLGALRHYVRVDFAFSAPRFKMVSLALPITLAVSVLGAFAAELVQRGTAVLGFRTSMSYYSIPNEPLEFVISLVMLTVIPAFLEEILFRGLILQGLRCLGDGIALTASSVLFALAHFNLMQDVNAFIMGLLIGYFVLRTGSVWTGVILHFSVNLVSFFELLVFRTVLSGCSELIGNLVSLLFLLAGAAAFFIFIRREPSAFSTPLLKGSLLSSSKRMILCFGSTGMLLALLMFVFFTVRAVI